MAVIHEVTNALEFMTEQAKSYTTVEMEMMQNAPDFKDFTQQTNQMAQAFSSTTQNVQEAVTVFANYNQTLEQTLQRTQAAIILANLTGQSIKDSSNAILGMTQQFGLSSEQSLHMVDILSSTSRQLLISFPQALQEVASGIQKVGSVADQGGLSLEKLSAMIGVVAENTRQSGDTIGKILKLAA